MRYNIGAAGNKNVVTYASGTNQAVKALSRGYTCGLLYDSTTANSEKLNIVRFVATNNDLI